MCKIVQNHMSPLHSSKFSPVLQCCDICRMHYFKLHTKQSTDCIYFPVWRHCLEFGDIQIQIQGSYDDEGDHDNDDKDDNDDDDDDDSGPLLTSTAGIQI